MPLVQLAPDADRFLEHARRLLELVLRRVHIAEVVHELSHAMAVTGLDCEREPAFEDGARLRGPPFEVIEKSQVAEQPRQCDWIVQAC